MKLSASLLLVALPLACTERQPRPSDSKGAEWSRSEAEGERWTNVINTLKEEREKLEVEAQEVERKLKTTTDATERERLLAEQLRLGDRLRENADKNARARGFR
jgi:hypothetical protein